jgi:hypothetical protein
LLKVNDKEEIRKVAYANHVKHRYTIGRRLKKKGTTLENKVHLHKGSPCNVSVRLMVSPHDVTGLPETPTYICAMYLV